MSDQQHTFLVRHELLVVAPTPRVAAERAAAQCADTTRARMFEVTELGSHDIDKVTVPAAGDADLYDNGRRDCEADERQAAGEAFFNDADGE